MQYTFPHCSAKLSAVYAELENMYSSKRSKSLKNRPLPTQDSLLELEPVSRTASPTMLTSTGGELTPHPSKHLN